MTNQKLIHGGNINGRGRGLKPKKKVEPIITSKYSGDVKCLRCDEMFYSIDRRHYRICPGCKGRELPEGADVVESSLSNYRLDHTPRY